MGGWEWRACFGAVDGCMGTERLPPDSYFHGVSFLFLSFAEGCGVPVCITRSQLSSLLI